MNLDYLGPTAPNVNHETGIRYGYVGANRLNPEAVDEIITTGIDLNFEEAVEDFKAALTSAIDDWSANTPTDVMIETAMQALSDWCSRKTVTEIVDMVRSYDWTNGRAELVDTVWDRISDQVTDGWDSDGTTFRYERDGLILLYNTNDNDVCVIDSPVVARRGLCSPCAPNGCYLETPGEFLCYALPSDWFEEGEMPYEVAEVPSSHLVGKGPDDFLPGAHVTCSRTSSRNET